MIGVGLLVASLLLIAGLTYRNTRQLNEDATWVTNTQVVLNLTSDVMLTMVDAETGMRGFLITGQDEYLQPYDAALVRLDGLVAELKGATKDDSGQHTRITKLEEMTAARMGYLRQVIGLRRKSAEESSAFIATGEGKAQMDAIRQHIAEMRNVENESLKDRGSRTATTYQVAVVTGLLTAVLGLVAVGLLVWLMRRSLSARQKANDALRESDQFTRGVLDNNLSTFVGVTTTDGTVTYANRAPLEAAGIPASEVFGKKFWDCYWWSYSPDIQAQLREACERAASGAIVRYDVPVRMAGDTRVWIDFQVAPLRDAGGRITHLIPSAIEIDSRHAAEEQLRANKERTRLATEATEVGIWEWNVRTNAILWDAQMFRLYGIPPTADGFVQYGDWSGAVLPEDLPDTERILQDTVRRGGQRRREFRIRRRNDGAVRHIESVEITRANAQGDTAWVVGTNLDVTARNTAEIQSRQLAADLSEASLRKDEFLATLAHELRNPLAPIRTGLQLMKLAGGQQAAIEQTRAMMERQLTQMVRLVDDLMDVSRISRGTLTLRKEQAPLAAVLDSAVESSRSLIEQMGHQLTVTLTKQPLIIDADMTRLAQVFLNLLNNAAKYTDRGGHIQLNAAREGSDAVVTVKDTGIGIAADQLSRIYEMFAQVDRSLEKSQGGLGIGLTLAKHLVEIHGGSVETKSEGLGKGSEFVVRLPVVIEASRPHESDREAEQHATSPHRILIVDDNRDGADSLSEILRLMGHDTRTAYDGQEGMDVAAAFQPGVVVLDIGLPTLNGYDVCRRIREQPWGKGVVLIALTGWGQDDDRRRSQDAGFDHHLVKPLDPEALMKLLAGLDGERPGYVA